ncbi:MAG: RNA polymerase sigma factor [Oscillospiraceae bacterium]
MNEEKKQSLLSNSDFIESLYTTHYKVLKHAALNYTKGNEDLAEDRVQETILRIFKKADVLRTLTPCQQKKYLIQTVKNLCLDEIAKAVRKNTLQQKLTDQLVETLFSLESTTEINLIKQAEIDALWYAIECLPEREQTLLVRRYILKHNDNDIAAAIGVNSNSIRVYTQRAKKHLKCILDNSIFCEE